MLDKWRTRSEFWETQALGYITLSYVIEPQHPTASEWLFGYGLFTAVAAFAVLLLSKRTP